MKKKQIQRSDVLWLAAAALLILLQFWWLPGDPRTPDDSFSNTVSGKRGLYETLQVLSEQELMPPVRRESAQLIPDDADMLVIISPDRYPDEHEQSELVSFVANGGTLFFAPNWTEPDCEIPRLNLTTQDRFFREDEHSVSTASAPGNQQQLEAEIEQLSKQLDDGGTADSGEESTEPETSTVEAPKEDPNVNEDDAKEEDDDIIQSEAERVVRRSTTISTVNSPDDIELRVSSLTVTSPLVEGSVPWRTRAAVDVPQDGAEVLVETVGGAPQAASWQYGSGWVIVSASPDVFSNSSLLFPDRAELAVRLIEHGHNAGPVTNYGNVVVSEFLNSSDKYHGTAVLMSPALRSGTLQLLLTALLVGWFGFHRFGPAEKVLTSQRRSLEESAAAVGNLHFRTNGGSEAVRSYLDYMTVQLQKHFGPSVRLDNTSVIASRTGLDGNEVDEAIRKAMRMAKSSSVSNSAAGTCVRQLSEILDRLKG